MLLRLIPLPTAETPAPPTILFTLPTPVAGPADLAPHNPYKPHSLPAPPALSTHSSVCKAASLPCPTLMAGESSSWINTIVQEVTFLPTLGEIQVLLVDGSGVVIPLREGGAGKVLDQVRDHVIESGRLMDRAAKAAAAGKMQATSSSASQDSATRPPLKKGESLLMSFFSPLIGGRRDEDKAPAMVVSGSVVGRELSARQHRRLARSELVDCYRRWVLNGLKSLLPPTYILFTSQSMIQTHHQSLLKTEAELRVLLSIAGQLPATPPTSPKAEPASPVLDTKESVPFPPALALPAHLRLAYVNHLSAHSVTSTKISDLEKLVKKHEREERRNRWDDSLPAIQKRHRPMPSPIVAVSSPLRQAWVAVPNPTQPGASYLVAYESSGMPPLSPSGSSWSSACSSWGSDGEDETEAVDAARVQSGGESSDEDEDAYDGSTIEDQVVRISQKSATGAVQGLGIGAVY